MIKETYVCTANVGSSRSEWKECRTEVDSRSALMHHQAVLHPSLTLVEKRELFEVRREEADGMTVKNDALGNARRD